MHAARLLQGDGSQKLLLCQLEERLGGYGRMRVTGHIFELALEDGTRIRTHPQGFGESDHTPPADLGMTILQRLGAGLVSGRAVRARKSDLRRFADRFVNVDRRPGEMRDAPARLAATEPFDDLSSDLSVWMGQPFASSSVTFGTIAACQEFEDDGESNVEAVLLVTVESGQELLEELEGPLE